MHFISPLSLKLRFTAIHEYHNHRVHTDNVFDHHTQLSERSTACRDASFQNDCSLLAERVPHPYIMEIHIKAQTERQRKRVRECYYSKITQQVKHRTV